MTPDIEADIADGRWASMWQDSVRKIEAISAHVLRHEQIDMVNQSVEISFLLTDDAQIRALNNTHRGKDTPTNVLSFPSGEALDGGDFVGFGPPVLLGDIAMAFETVQREALEKEIAFQDHAAHLVIHGVLHLLGYDHQNDAEAQRMEAKEIAFCRDFAIANPYEA